MFNEASLGFINFNWDSFTETFCCAAMEILATELPVFSYAAGALPETLGQTGGTGQERVRVRARLLQP